MASSPDETVLRMGPTKMRQMNLEECCKKIKLGRYKFPKPYIVTLEPIVIDSDSDGEKTTIDMHRDTKRKISFPIKLENSKIIRKDRVFNDIKNNIAVTSTRPIAKAAKTKCTPTTSSASSILNITAENSSKECKIFSTVASKPYLQSLLGPEEINILNRLKNLNSDYQMLILKLYSEKYDWHNIYQFCEKNNIKDAIGEFEFLQQCNFIDIDNNPLEDMDAYDLLQKLDQKKLKEIIKENKVINCKKYSNQTMIDSIVCACTNQKTLTGQSYKDKIMTAIKKKFGFNIKLQPNIYEAIKNIYILETLFNPKIKSVKDYIKIITRNITFPKVPLEEYNIFTSRDNFLSYTKAINLQQSFENILSTNLIRSQKASAIKDLGEEIYSELRTMDFQDFHTKAPHMNTFTPQFILIDLLTNCCNKIYTNYANEVKKWLEYLIDYCPSSKKFGHWNYQLIWLYMKHLEEVDLKSATRLLVQVFSSHSDKLSDTDKHNLAYLGQLIKLNKSLQINEIFFERISEMAPAPIDIWAFSLEEFFSDINVTRKINKETGFTHLEQVALDHYSQTVFSQGKNCQVVLSTLFVAYFWDILYNPNKNPHAVFISELQEAPLDFYHENFYSNRIQAIDDRLRDIRQTWSFKEFVEFGMANFKNNYGLYKCFQLLLQDSMLGMAADVGVFGEIVESIGRRVLAEIFLRLLEDLSTSITGVPSLLIYDPKRKMCKFIEVKNAKAKTPVEKLLWLQYLTNIGAIVEIFSIKNPSKRADTTIKFEETSASEGEEEEIEDED